MWVDVTAEVEIDQVVAGARDAGGSAVGSVIVGAIDSGAQGANAGAAAIRNRVHRDHSWTGLEVGNQEDHGDRQDKRDDADEELDRGTCRRETLDR